MNLGETVTELIHTDEGLRARGALKKEANELLMIKYMFGGFVCHNLFNNSYSGCNGLQIRLKNSTDRIKVGISVQFTWGDYHQLVGFLLAKNQEMTTYELPLKNFMHESPNEEMKKS